MSILTKRAWRGVEAKCKALFNTQGRSNLSKEAIERHCRGYILVIPVPTRWTSEFNAYQRIVDLFEKTDGNLNGLMDELGFQRFSDNDVTMLNEYCKVYNPFIRAINVLQGERSCYVGFLLPIITKLKKELTDMSTNSTFCAFLTEALIAGIDKRFEEDFAKDEYYIAAALHPQIKLSWLESAEKRTYIWGLIRDEVRAIEAKDATTKSVRKPSKPGAGDVDFFFPKGDHSAVDDLESYISQPAGRPLEDLNRYPILKQLFRKYNTLLPSSGNL